MPYDWLTQQTTVRMRGTWSGVIDVTDIANWIYFNDYVAPVKGTQTEGKGKVQHKSKPDRLTMGVPRPGSMQSHKYAT